MLEWRDAMCTEALAHMLGWRDAMCTEAVVHMLEWRDAMCTEAPAHTLGPIKTLYRCITGRIRPKLMILDFFGECKGSYLPWN